MSIRSQGRHPIYAAEAEAGFMLVYVVLLAALVLIALSVAAPIVAKQIRRDKELESEHRAEQYVRAIRLYYRKTGNYPPSIAALENTNNIRFLRKQYVDPLTGKSDWRLIHRGENKTTVKGFFGKPLSGLNTSGAGSLGSASTLGTGFGGATTATGGTTSTIGATTGLAAGFSGATIGSNSTTSTTTGGATTGGSTTSGSTNGTSTTDSSSGTLGQVIGVGTSKTGPSILNPNGQTTYETWEFIYDPLIEQLYQKANILGGGMTSTPASGFGSNAVTGQPNSGATNTNTTPGSTTPSTPTSNSPFSSSPQ